MERGVWCLFRMAGQTEKPDEFFSRDTENLPFNADLSAKGWSLISSRGAGQRGWEPAQIDKEKVKSVVAETVKKYEAATVADVICQVKKEFSDIPDRTVTDVTTDLIHGGKLASYSGEPDQQEKPSDLMYGQGVIAAVVRPETILATPELITKRGWIKKQAEIFMLSGREGANRMFPLLGTIGSLYARGAKSTIRTLEMIDLEIPNGGRLHLTMENVPPEGMKTLDEFLEILGEIVAQGSGTELELEIEDPDDACLLIQKLKGI